MAEKKTAKKENSEVDLNEILGNIKTVVSEEKEALESTFRILETLKQDCQLFHYMAHTRNQAQRTWKE